MKKIEQMEKTGSAIQKDISPAMRKYLIGKEYYRRVTEAEDRYIQAAKEQDEEYIRTHKMNCKQAIAERLAKECHLSKSTVISYACYSEVVDEVSKKNEQLAEQILSGETKMGYRELKQLIKVL
ncbi:MAG: hypothetical protein J6B50_11255 [Lachnospiraceae bacterium]|nr:hypothetical protein [Lachnospiraceae bacterium]MBP3595268.1 hypothetical protein [Lachnospiraceae bacterium]